MTSAIEEYNDALQSGQIIACRKLKAVYKHLVKNIKYPGKFHYSQEAAQKAVDFIENFCCIPKMKGTPKFKLELWQKALVEATFGFVEPPIPGNFPVYWPEKRKIHPGRCHGTLSAGS